MSVRKEAVALSELGEYSQTAPLFDEALRIFKQIAAADNANTKDVRALGDVKRLLVDMSSAYEDAADPALAEGPAARPRNLLTALSLWEQAEATIAQIVKQDPSYEDWKAELANAQVHAGTIRNMLHEPENSEAQTVASLAVLRGFAIREHASPKLLYLAATAFLDVEPASLRDAQFAASCAARGVALTHRRDAEWLLSLSHTWRASSRIEESRAAAREGLALLPPPQPGTVKWRVRKLLELQTR